MGVGERYFCPTSGDVESPEHGGFKVCCDRPDLHLPPNWKNRPYADEIGWTENHRAFRDWLMLELRVAGCEDRTLSAMGMAQVTVENLVRQGWTITPPDPV